MGRCFILNSARSFKAKPVTILGVNSDDDIRIIREAKGREELDYRVWWDGHGEEPTKGPIATAWHVSGWPTIYILDDRGVLRFVQKRRAEVISAVNKLLMDNGRRANPKPFAREWGEARSRGDQRPPA